MVMTAGGNANVIVASRRAMVYHKPLRCRRTEWIPYRPTRQRMPV
jgi:hypothetical protein